MGRGGCGRNKMGTDATYPLRRRSRTPARRGPAGRRRAHHPAMAMRQTRRRSMRRSREVRRRVRFRASIGSCSREISLLHADVAAGVLRGRPEPDAPARPSKAATIRCRPWKGACSAPLCSPRTTSRGGLLRARPFTVTRWHASFTSDKLSFVVATRLVHWSTRGNVYIKRANRKQTRRDDDALVQERLLHLPHGLRDDRHGFVHLRLAHDERRQEPQHVSRAGGDHQQTRVPADPDERTGGDGELYAD